MDNLMEARRAANRESCRRWRAANPDYGKKWQQANAEKAKEYGKKWRDANPYYNRIANMKRRCTNGQFTQEDIAFLMRLQDGKCDECKIAIDNTTMQIDHFVPVTKGGSNELHNLILLCRICNMKKWGKDPLDWRYGDDLSRLIREARIAAGVE